MTNVPPGMVRRATAAVATSSTGRSRTVTVELLLMRSPFFCGNAASRVRTRRVNVTKKQQLEATLLYSAGPAPAGHRTTDVSPGGLGSGCDSHTVPPL